MRRREFCLGAAGALAAVGLGAAPRSAWAEGDRLFPVEIKNRYGYIDASGRLVVPAKFEAAGPFREGLAYVTLDKQEKQRAGFIDTRGRWAIKPVLDPCPEMFGSYEFREGLSPVAFGAKWNGMRWCDGKEGYIDREGVWRIPPNFAHAGLFFEGVAWVRKPGNDKSELIDTSGRTVIPPRFKEMSAFSEGLCFARACEETGRITSDWGYIDKKGNWSIAPQFESVDGFCEGLAAVRHKGRWGYIDHKGSFVIAAGYDKASSFAEGLAWVRKGEGYAFINKQGQVVFNLARGLVAQNFSEGLAVAFREGPDSLPVYGFIDKEGKVVIPLQYEQAYQFEGGLARVTLKGEPEGIGAYIDRTGHVVWKEDIGPQYYAKSKNR